MTDTLVELVERCEAAAGPDRVIDEAISAITLLPNGYSFPGNAPGFTRSLDAAMTLVPEGADVRIDSAGWYATINGKSGHGATAALALCAAALRARHAISQGEG